MGGVLLFLVRTRFCGVVCLFPSYVLQRRRVVDRQTVNSRGLSRISVAPSCFRLKKLPLQNLLIKVTILMMTGQKFFHGLGE